MWGCCIYISPNITHLSTSTRNGRGIFLAKPLVWPKHEFKESLSGTIELVKLAMPVTGSFSDQPVGLRLGTECDCISLSVVHIRERP